MPILFDGLILSSEILVIFEEGFSIYVYVEACRRSTKMEGNIVF